MSLPDHLSCYAQLHVLPNRVISMRREVALVVLSRSLYILQFRCFMSNLHGFAFRMTERLKDLITSAEKCIRDGELDRGRYFPNHFTYYSGIHLLHDSLDSYKSTPIDDDDKEILSVIYSQLGNAYYMRKDFAKACEFHGKDCEVSS